MFFSYSSTNSQSNPGEVAGAMQTQGAVISQVGAASFARQLDDDGVVVLDLRTPAEFATGRIAGAVNLDFYGPEFRQKLASLDRSTAYKIYCNSGNRSKSTLGLMRQLGFKDVTELEGGIQAWASVGQQVCTNC